MARSKTILLVDQDSAMLKFVTLILENEGYRVLTAVDGDEALQKVRQTPPDLVLLEIVLPRKNGYQVCRTLREDKRMQGLPIVFLSGKCQPSDRFWAKRVGAAGFVAKPFDPADLVREIRARLRKSQLVTA